MSDESGARAPHIENDLLDVRARVAELETKNKRLEGVARAGAHLLQQEGHVLLADGVSQVIDDILAARLPHADWPPPRRFIDCTCDHDPGEHGWVHCDVPDCPCEGAWEE